MDLWVGSDVPHFLGRARAFLEGAPERILLARIVAGMEAGLYPEIKLGLGTGPGGDVVAAALRTPPYKLVAVGFAADADALLAAWEQIDHDLSGVSAQPDDARAIAAAWARRTGGSARPCIAEAMHQLSFVIAPTETAPGGLRPAGVPEAGLLADWFVAFCAEAGLAQEAGAAARFRVRVATGGIYVWEFQDQPVAMVGHSRPVAGITNVAPVYTPPALRGRGYATAATAALSQLLLDAGAERCMLFTDLANPISNHIYAKIGYVRFGLWEEHEFIPV